MPTPQEVFKATPGAGPPVMALPEASLEDFCVKNVPGFAKPMILGQFGLGQSNPTYVIVDGNGKRYVLRKKPPGKIVSPTAHQVDREFRILNALAKSGSGFPSPVPYVYSDDSSVCGTPFYIMEYVGPGRVFNLDIRLPDARDAAERAAMWKNFLQVMATLHKIDYKKIGLQGFGKDSGYYTRSIANWGRLARQQARVRSLDDPSREVGDAPYLDRMLEWFEKNVIEDEATIMHGDLHIHNVMFAMDSPEIITVLDWELATIGHPLADLAHVLSNYLHPTFVPTPGTPTFEEAQKMYCEAVGRPYPIPGFAFCCAFSAFRMGVIAQGIAARYYQKQNASTRAKATAESWQLNFLFAAGLMGLIPLDKNLRLGAL